MKPTLECDKALIAEYGGVKYGLSTLFEKAMDNENKDVVIQYEVRYQKGLECGGAYLKVFGEGVLSSPEDLRDSTPYVLMFGPDYCGKTNHVHVIIPHLNPVSGKWEEKHLVGGPSVMVDNRTHLYTLIIRRDASIDILVDQINKFSGNMHHDFDPPFSSPSVGEAIDCEVDDSR